MLKTFFKKYYTDYYTLFFIGNGQNLLIHPKSEEGEIPFDWVVWPDFTKFLCKFQGGIHACALACYCYLYVKTCRCDIVVTPILKGTKLGEGPF